MDVKRNRRDLLLILYACSAFLALDAIALFVIGEPLFGGLTLVAVASLIIGIVILRHAFGTVSQAVLSS